MLTVPFTEDQVLFVQQINSKYQYASFQGPEAVKAFFVYLRLLWHIKFQEGSHEMSEAELNVAVET